MPLSSILEVPQELSSRPKLHRLDTECHFESVRPLSQSTEFDDTDYEANHASFAGEEDSELEDVSSRTSFDSVSVLQCRLLAIVKLIC